MVEEFIESILVARLCTFKINNFLIGKMNTHHASQSIDRMCYSFLLKNLVDALAQGFAFLIQRSINGRIAAEFIEQSITGAHGDGISAQRTRLVHIPQRGNMLHDLFFSAKGAHRHTTPDNFPKRYEICFYLKQLLRSSPGNTEAAHHLLKH